MPTELYRQSWTSDNNILKCKMHTVRQLIDDHLYGRSLEMDWASVAHGRELFVRVRIRGYRLPDRIFRVTWPQVPYYHGHTTPKVQFSLRLNLTLTVSSSYTIMSLSRKGHASHSRRCLIGLPFSQVDVDSSRCVLRLSFILDLCSANTPGLQLHSTVWGHLTYSMPLKVKVASSTERHGEIGFGNNTSVG